MKSNDTHSILPIVNSFEEYENIQPKAERFENAAQAIIHSHQLPDEALTLFSEGTNIVYSYGQHRVIKIFPPFHQDQFKSELLVLKHLQAKLSIKTPVIEHSGEIEGWPYIVMSQLEGTLLENLWEGMAQSNKMIIIRELGSLIHEVHSLSSHGLESIDCHWENFIHKQINQCVERHQSLNLSESILQQIPNYLETVETLLSQIDQPVILTGEYTPMNFLVKQVSGVWHIDELIDFGDAMLGLPEYDLLGPGVFLVQGDKELLREFLLSYGYSTDSMTEKLSHQLTALMLLHRYSNLNIQVRIKNWKSLVFTIKDLEKLVWGF